MTSRARQLYRAVVEAGALQEIPLTVAASVQWLDHDFLGLALVRAR